MVGIGAFPVFMRTRRNIEPYSLLKPTKVGFIFIGLNSLSRAEYLAAVNHVTQAVGFKELRLESKLLNRWLGKEAKFIRFSYFTLSTFYIRRKTVTFSKYFLFLLIMRKKDFGLCIFSVVYSDQFFSKLTNI